MLQAILAIERKTVKVTPSCCPQGSSLVAHCRRACALDTILGMEIPHALVERYRDTWHRVFDETIDVDFARASLTELTLLVARAEYPDLVHRLGLEDSRRRSN